jgi:hypothetical protein
MVHYRVAEQGRFSSIPAGLAVELDEEGAPPSAARERSPRAGSGRRAGRGCPAAAGIARVEPTVALPAGPLNVIGAWNVVVAKLVTIYASAAHVRASTCAATRLRHRAIRSRLARAGTPIADPRGVSRHDQPRRNDVCSLSRLVSRSDERCEAQAARTSSGSLLTLTINHGLRYSTGESVATVMPR